MQPIVGGHTVRLHTLVWVQASLSYRRTHDDSQLYAKNKRRLSPTMSKARAHTCFMQAFDAYVVLREERIARY